MSRFYHFLIIAIVAVLFVPASISARAAQTYYPSGLSAARIQRGIYPGDNADSCCWMGKAASFQAVAPVGADTTLITVFIPDYALHGSPQAFRARIGSSGWQERCCYTPGLHVLAFSLGGQVQRVKPLPIGLAMRETFVPAKSGINADPRTLSVLLRSVSFENAQSGEQFAPGGTYVGQPRIDLALLVLAGIVALLLAYMRPILGLPALIFSSPFLLAYYTHGTTITLPKVVLLGLGLGLLTRALLRRVRHDGFGLSATLRSRTLWIVLGAQVLFIASMLLASVHAFSHAAAIRETLKVVQYALTLIVAYTAYRSEPNERVLRWSFAGVTLLVSLLAVAEEFTGSVESTMIHGHVFARIAGPLEGPNQLAAFLGVTLPVLVAFAALRTPLIVERVAIAIGTIACVLTVSRGGIAALGLAFALLLALRYGPRPARAVGVAAGALFAVIFGLAVCEFAGVLPPVLQHLFGNGDAYNGGLGSRPALWHGAYEMWRAHPLFGVGPGNFELLVSHYAPGVHTHANSIYFQTLAEQGLLGAIALAALLAASLTPFVRRLREPLALGACIATVAMGFHQIVDCLWLYPKVGVLFWIVIAAGAAQVDAQTVRIEESAPAMADLTPASSSSFIA